MNNIDATISYGHMLTYKTWLSNGYQLCDHKWSLGHIPSYTTRLNGAYLTTKHDYLPSYATQLNAFIWPLIIVMFRDKEPK